MAIDEIGMAFRMWRRLIFIKPLTLKSPEGGIGVFPKTRHDFLRHWCGVIMVQFDVLFLRSG